MIRVKLRLGPALQFCAGENRGSVLALRPSSSCSKRGSPREFGHRLWFLCGLCEHSKNTNKRKMDDAEMNESALVIERESFLYYEKCCIIKSSWKNICSWFTLCIYLVFILSGSVLICIINYMFCFYDSNVLPRSNLLTDINSLQRSDNTFPRSSKLKGCKQVRRAYGMPCCVRIEISEANS